MNFKAASANEETTMSVVLYRPEETYLRSHYVVEATEAFLTLNIYKLYGLSLVDFMDLTRAEGKLLIEKATDHLKRAEPGLSDLEDEIGD